MISLILLIVVIGFVCWLLVTLVPMPAPFPRVIVAVGCLIVLVLVLQALGLVGPIGSLRLR